MTARSPSPLAQLSAQRVTSLYDLMDSAYDAPSIHAFSARLGHVPISLTGARRRSPCAASSHIETIWGEYPIGTVQPGAILQP